MGKIVDGGKDINGKSFLPIIFIRHYSMYHCKCAISPLQHP